jgi:hypothetical protein
MENLSFAIWMVGYSFTSTLSTYFYWLRNKENYNSEKGLYGTTSLINIVIWASVGYALYVRPL